MNRSSCRVEQILHPDDVVQSAQSDKKCSNLCWASELFTYLFGTCLIGQSRLETLISHNFTHRRAQPITGELDFEPKVMFQKTDGQLPALVSEPRFMLRLLHIKLT